MVMRKKGTHVYFKLYETQSKILLQRLKKCFKVVNEILYISQTQILLKIQLRYSGCHWKVYECCFMKQNCHFQQGLLQYKDVTIPLSSSDIPTTHYHFQKR